jgi:hypothetical protein
MGMEKGGIGFKMGMGQRLHVSIIAFVICFLLAIGVTVFASYHKGQKENAEIPKSNLTYFYKSVMALHKQQGRFPKDFAEVENLIWSKNKKDYKSKLYSDRNLVLSNNYLYIYIPGEQVCAIWAIPQGKFREEANTVYIVISPEKYEIWRGAALSQTEVDSIPRTPQVKTTDMARLGMFEQKKGEDADEKPKKKGGFGLFK